MLDVVFGFYLIRDKSLRLCASEKVFVNSLLWIKQLLFTARKTYRQFDNRGGICRAVLVNIIIGDSFPKITLFRCVWVNYMADCFFCKCKIFVIGQNVLMVHFDLVLVVGVALRIPNELRTEVLLSEHLVT